MRLMRMLIVELISIPVRSSGSTPSCMNISGEQYAVDALLFDADLALFMHSETLN